MRLQLMGLWVYGLSLKPTPDDEHAAIQGQRRPREDEADPNTRRMTTAQDATRAEAGGMALVSGNSKGGSPSLDMGSGLWRYLSTPIPLQCFLG